MSTQPHGNAAVQLQQHLGVQNALFQKQVHGGNWDELVNGIEPNVKHVLAESSNLIALTHETVTRAGIADGEFDSLCQLALRDLSVYVDRYLGIVEERAGRTGPTRSPEEFTEYLSLGTRLTGLVDEVQAVLGNQMFVLSERHAKAIDILRTQAEEEAQVAEAAPVENESNPAVEATTEEKAEVTENV